MSKLKDDLTQILQEKQEKIIPENIKKDISILGITGTAIILNGQEKTVTPTTTQQVITPDTDYNALTKVTVNAVDSSIDENLKPENIKSGITILGITGTYVGEIDVSL